VDDAAIADVVGSHLDSWYSHVASWWPPGHPATGDCSACSTSSVRAVLDLAAWPHDVVHPLATSFERVVGQVALTESDARGRLSRALVVHAPVINDVLEHCISPKLLEWDLDLTWLPAAS
jgi:hypothetical protein